MSNVQFGGGVAAEIETAWVTSYPSYGGVGVLLFRLRSG